MHSRRSGPSARFGEVLHEVEQGGLGPVDVVENEDDRTFPSPRLQEAAHRPGGLLRAARARQAEQPAEARGDRRGVGPLPRSGRADGCRDVVWPRELRQPESRPQRLGEGQPGDALAVREAPAAQHLGRVPQRSQELLDEPALAGPRGPEHREQAAGARLDDSAVRAGKRAASRSRPTIGASSLRARAGEPAASARMRQAVTGSAFPLAASGGAGSAATASRTSRHVGSPTSTSPGAAPDWSRDAVFIASPMRGPPPPATSTSPVVIPIRAPRAGSARRSRRRASRSWTSSPARTARRASSSWAAGTPKTAHTASPMNFSTRPPWRSTASRASAKYRSSSGRSTSGSWRSPSDVDPTRSQNSAVTTFRDSWAAAVGPSFVPQLEQKAASAGLPRPQDGQISADMSPRAESGSRSTGRA